MALLVAISEPHAPPTNNRPSFSHDIELFISHISAKGGASTVFYNLPCFRRAKETLAQHVCNIIALPVNREVGQPLRRTLYSSRTPLAILGTSKRSQFLHIQANMCARKPTIDSDVSNKFASLGGSPPPFEVPPVHHWPDSGSRCSAPPNPLGGQGSRSPI